MARKKATRQRKKNGTVVVVGDSSVVALDEQMAQDAGSGLEGTSSADYAIPFLRMLQDMNDEVKKRSDRYIDGAEPGLFYDTVTKELFNELNVIPCAMQRVLNEWVPREDGGGFRGRHDWNDKLAAQAREPDYRTEDGNQLTDTMQFYVLYQSNGEWKPAVFPLASTQLKRGQGWMSLIRDQKVQGKRGPVTAAMYSTVYTVEPEEQSNDKGNWFGVKIGVNERIGELDVYQMARSFHHSVTAGDVKVSAEEGEEGGTEDIPF